MSDQNLPAVDESSVIQPKWSAIRLIDGCIKIGSGSTPRGGKDAYLPSGVPFIRSMNVHFDKFKEKGLVYISDAAADKLKSVEVVENDVLLNITGASIGRVHIAPNKFVGARVNQHVSIIRPTTNLDAKFLWRYIASPEIQDQIHQNESGVTRQALTKEKIENFRFPLPPLAEQKVIAEKLDTLLAQVDNIKNRLDAVPKIIKRFRQSVLTSAVSGKLTEEWRVGQSLSSASDSLSRIKESRGLIVSKRNKVPEIHTKTDEFDIPDSWLWTSLDSLSSKIVDGVHHKPTYVEEGVSFLSVKDIKNNRLTFNHCKYISEATHTEIHPRCNPEKGDLLITKSGTIGRTAIVKTNKTFDLFVSVALIKPASEEVNIEFIDIALRNWISSIDISSRIVGTAIKNLHLRDMRVLALPFPTLEEQTEIVNRVEKLFAFADQIEQQVKNAQQRVNNLTQSILAKAFRGELTADWREQNPDLITGDNSAEALLAKIKVERDMLKSVKKVKKKK